MIVNVAPRPPYSDCVLIKMSVGTSNVFLAEYLPFLTGSPFPVLPFGPQMEGPAHPTLKVKVTFPLSFSWYKSSCRMCPKEHRACRTAGSQSHGPGGRPRPHHLPSPENTEPFMAAQGQAFSPRDNQEFTGTRFAFIVD